MTRFYLAARYPRRDEMEENAKLLSKTLGWVKTSHWTSLPEDGRTRREIASDDLGDVDDADVLILFTNKKGTETPGGGRFVELGYALAKGKTCFIVGHYENVFCHLCPVYPTLEDLILDHQVDRPKKETE